MHSKQKSRLIFARTAFVLTSLLSTATSILAEDGIRPAVENWRPKDGLYAEPGADFNSRCLDQTELSIDLGDKSVGGYEWGCKIDKVTKSTPDTIKLNMTCDDYNLALNLYPRDPKAEERKFKEIMLLKRINDKAMSVRKTLNGKFKDPAWQADYCAEEVQQAAARRSAEAGYKIPEQLLSPQQWRPRDGVYASPGADFNDRCTKSGDVVIGLTEGSVVSGQGDCKVVTLMNVGVASVSMDIACSHPSGKKAPDSNKKKNEPPSEAEGPETIRMSKIDDNSFFLQKTQNRNFKDAGGPVAYCPDEVQRIHAAKKTKS